MDLIISFSVIIFIGFVLGWKAREWQAIRTVDKYMKEAEKGMKAEVMNVNVHKENNSFYVYDKSNQAFITQVKTKEELFEYFTDKYPQKTVMMSKEDLALFDIV